MTDPLSAGLALTRLDYDVAQRHNAMMRRIYARRIEAGEILLAVGQAARYCGCDYETARAMARGGKVNVAELRQRERRAA